MLFFLWVGCNLQVRLQCFVCWVPVGRDLMFSTRCDLRGTDTGKLYQALARYSSRIKVLEHYCRLRDEPEQHL